MKETWKEREKMAEESQKEREGKIITPGNTSQVWATLVNTSQKWTKVSIISTIPE